MKQGERSVERRAIPALEELLASVPGLEIDHLERDGRTTKDSRPDLVAELKYAGKPLILIAEVKANGQPKAVRDAAHQVRRQASEIDGDVVPMIIVPFLSEQAQQVCRDEKVAYLDLMGNCRLVFDTVFVERRVEGRPEPERRALRSLFKPKSARILRAMLQEPERRWRVVELAHAAQVSIGLVSTVGAALRERDWADQSDEGLYLSDPDHLLDAWAQDYEQPRGEEVRLYTHLHGKQLTDKLLGLCKEEGRIALASYSAAEWLAPYARHSTNYFYADERGLGALHTALALSAPPRGANIVIIVPDDDGVLCDAEPIANGLVVTSPVQTYLDLMHAGERGEEAAQHLRKEHLRWPK